MQDLQKNTTFDTKNQFVVFLFFFFLIGLIWQILREKKIKEKGIYIIGKVIKTEMLKGGFVSTFSYYFEDKVYETTIKSKKGSEDVGDLYFIMLIPENPGAIVFLDNSPVPDCLHNVKVPLKGWKNCLTVHEVLHCTTH